MVESRTFYITRCDDDQSETGTPPQGYLRRRGKKSRVGEVTTHALSRCVFSRRDCVGLTEPRQQIEKQTSLRRSLNLQQPLDYREQPASAA